MQNANTVASSNRFHLGDDAATFEAPAHQAPERLSIIESPAIDQVIDMGDEQAPGQIIRGQPGQPTVHLSPYSPTNRRSGAPSPDAAAGALPTLRAATDPGVLGGQYYGPDGFGEQRGYPKVVASSDKSHDVDVQRRLFAVSEELTGVVYPVD